MTIETVAERFDTLGRGDEQAFEALAAAAVRYQRAHNPVYERFCASGQTYLPIEAFKLAPVTTFPPDEAELVFESSGTGRGTPSRHFVRDASIYERSFRTHFEQVFGAGPMTLVAHLPHYTERGSRSSLLYMVEDLVQQFGDEASGFFLKDPSLLTRAIAHSREAGHRLVVFGAAFGLLDLVEAGAPTLPEEALVVETGGMKTYRRAVGRAELHARLADGFGIARDHVWSEYGMCELLSQAYTCGGAVFFPPPWMRCQIVDPARPERVCPEGEPGALAVFDLANVHTVSALLTQDRAVRRGDGFEVLGRLSEAELRGCNFLIERS